LGPAGPGHRAGKYETFLFRATDSNQLPSFEPDLWRSPLSDHYTEAEVFCERIEIPVAVQ
jgi:hypothetical protein